LTRIANKRKGPKGGVWVGWGVGNEFLPVSMTSEQWGEAKGGGGNPFGEDLRSHPSYAKKGASDTVVTWTCQLRIKPSF